MSPTGRPGTTSPRRRSPGLPTIENGSRSFSETTLPGITVHEVAPGHFSHGRAIRRAPTEVRRVLHSAAFVEGWAHYAEELCVEEGFCADDPRFARRLARGPVPGHPAGLRDRRAHRRDDGRRGRPAVRGGHPPGGRGRASEARHATFDPTYGRYTWGKLEIMGLRERARKEWDAGFSLRRFHSAMLELGSPPLGLLAVAVERG